MATVSEIRKQVIEKVTEELSGSYFNNDEEVLEIIDEVILQAGREYPISIDERLQLRRDLFNRIRRLDVLQELLEDDTITEIMVNGEQEIFIERKGRLLRSGKQFESGERLTDIIGQIASGVNRVVNISSPILDARLEDGSRVNVVLPPIALNGPILTIRRFPDEDIKDTDLLSYDSISEEVLFFLNMLVIAGYNILISGGTGAGKTTFLNILSNYIPKTERIITIEDSAELKISGIDNLVRLEARQGTSEGAKPVTIRDLIKTSLRMRPDRIVVGEVRGEEAIDMLQAFNVGQDGSLSTIHANSSADALLRLETMIMLNTEIPLSALRRQIVSGVDIIVHLGRLRDKSRRLLEIREVTGMENNDITTSLLYEFCEEKMERGKIYGNFIKRNDIANRIKLQRAGLNNEI